MYVRDFVLLSLTFLLCLFTSRGEELWREDVTGRMNIGVTASGFDQIRLDCGSNNFQVVVETLADFRGVIYTRGSFYSRKAPCFLDANGGRRFRLKIPYDQCNVEDDGEKFQVTLILQHDKELIMPGDGAFALQCDLSAKDSKSFKVSAVSSISLADPDPSGKDVPTHLKSTVSAPNVVIFKPSDIRPRKSPQRIEFYFRRDYFVISDQCRKILMKRPNAGYFLCCEIKEMQHRLRHNFYRKIAQYLVIIELTNSVNSFQLS